jgi:hypothetical protein
LDLNTTLELITSLKQRKLENQNHIVRNLFLLFNISSSLKYSSELTGAPTIGKMDLRKITTNKKPGKF